jgi:MFS family permease
LLAISQQSVLLRATAMAALVLAVFVVSIGYGVVLPLLPYLIERLLGIGVQAAEVSRHTGLLTAVYTLSLFLFSPLWGRLADRRGPHSVLLIGLVGFALTSLVFSFVESITAVYAERALSGLFAAAVTPVAAAAVGALTTTEQARARRLTFVSMAGISGFLLGPMLGIFITRMVELVAIPSLPVGSIAMPLAATGILSFLAALAVGLAVRGAVASNRET